ncbi:MAG: hypothetical protein MK008_09120 [Bdellovibrionales bacterium]|nr:hypothetical protein [Bdellovibrionales bacterium]
MEKISGILPATSRVSTVDLQSSGSVRPGAPSYGRPVGSASLTENKSAISHIKKDSLEEMKSKAIEELNSDFFMLKPSIHKKIDEQVQNLPSIDQLEVKSPIDELEQRWENETSLKGENLNLKA